METKEELNEQLKDIAVKIDKAVRRLKALRRPSTEAAGTRGKVSFITSRQRMIEVAEAEKRLDGLRQQEKEIRDKLHPRSR
jgi:cell division protein ZapA (FtsZ GTPase activity inhibitor)